MEHSAFPSDETLAAFIDGRLDEETRKRVVAHVADCEDCYGTVMAAGDFRRENEAAERKPHAFAPHKTRLLIGLAAAAVIGIVLYHPLSVRYVQRHDEAELRDAANKMPIRVTDARLSLDLAYKPLAKQYRGNEDQPDDLRISVAAARVEEDARPDASSQHILGLALLLKGDRDNAVRALERALAEETDAVTLTDGIRQCKDVALLNDISAARVALADVSHSVESNRIAVAAAEAAWRLNPESRISSWNRAVALERVNRSAAARAWTDYLYVDRSSVWNGAAKERLRKLQSGE